jgi:hypothetical protein
LAEFGAKLLNYVDKGNANLERRWVQVAAINVDRHGTLGKLVSALPSRSLISSSSEAAKTYNLMV